MALLTPSLGSLFAISTALIIALTSPSRADELPYPPTYFSMFRVDLMVAKDVAQNCPTVEIDRERYLELAEEQMQMIERDGFSRDNWQSEMKDIPVGLKDRPNVEFYMKWGIRRDRPESFCEAARMEQINRTRIGSLLRQIK